MSMKQLDATGTNAVPSNPRPTSIYVGILRQGSLRRTSSTYQESTHLIETTCPNHRVEVPNAFQAIYKNVCRALCIVPHHHNSCRQAGQSITSLDMHRGQED